MKMESVKQTNIYFIYFFIIIIIFFFFKAQTFFTRFILLLWFILLFLKFKEKLSRRALFNLSSEQNTLFFFRLILGLP